ncbi:unnamed protein product [Effrenium voratum]|nr:unnamed protein product [Effrenium voratum]
MKAAPRAERKSLPEEAQLTEQRRLAKQAARQGQWSLCLRLARANDPVVLSCAVQACAKARRWQQALSTLQTAQARALDLGVVALNSAASAASSGRCWQVALRLLEAPTSDATSVNIAIAACARGKHWQGALKLLEEMPMRKLAQDVFSFNSAMKALARWPMVLVLLRLMPKVQVAPDAVSYNSAMAVAPRGIGEELLAEMLRQKVLPTVITFNTAMAASQDPLSLLEELKAWSLQPNVISLNSCIKACGDWQQSLALLLRMEGEYVAPDLISFNSLLVGGAPFHLMLPAMAQRRLSPDLVSYSAAVSRCAAKGGWEEALALLASCPGRPDIAILNAAMTVCAEAGQWERALHLLNVELLRRSLSPDVVSFNAAIAACDKGQQWDLALVLLQRLQKKLRPSLISYSSAASACEGAKQWPAALSLLLAMRQTALRPDDVAFNTVMSAATSGQQWTRALGVLEAREADGISFTVVTCNAAITAMACAANSDKALLLLQRGGLQPSSVTWNSLLGALSGGRDWRGALRALADMRAQRVAPEVLSLAGAVESLSGSAGLALTEQLQELREEALSRAKEGLLAKEPWAIFA